MQQFVLIPATVYNNRGLNAQSVTKHELPKYQDEQNPLYRIDSFKREFLKKLFAKTDFLVDKPFVLSGYQALKFAESFY